MGSILNFRQQPRNMLLTDYFIELFDVITSYVCSQSPRLHDH